MASIPISLTTATFQAKTATFRTTQIRETKLSNFSSIVTCISPTSSGITAEKGYNNIPYVIPLKESSITEQIPFTNEHRFRNGVNKIKEIMSKKARESDSELEELIMIDFIQRLGLEYYFREDIHACLERHYEKWNTLGDGGDDLHEVALRFRLLRQGGYNAHVDIFNKFKDNDGKFKQELHEDIKGLLSLFEASSLSIQGEDTMDEAGEFSEKFLKTSLLNIIKQPKANIIENALRNPFHKSLARVFAKSFLQDFKHSLELLHDFNGMRHWMSDLQDLARIDFEITRTTHRNEIGQISRWRKEVNSANQLSFARIDPFKWYMWSLGTFPGPNMEKQRIELARPISFVYIIDDIFDIYGTLDELALFTEVVNRWEYIDELPNYMKVCFKALRDMVDDISRKVYIEHGWNPEDTLKKLWADLCNAFLMEAKWDASGQLPSSREYLKNGIVSSGVHAVLGHAFFLLGEEINTISVDALNNLPSIISSTAIVVRLWNDVGIDKDESRDGNDGSYLDCYMNEYKGGCMKSARQHVNRLIIDAWKCLNEEHLSRTSPFSTNFKEACLNFARMVPIMYSSNESHHLWSLEKYLKSSLH